jgi:hypothetical protein
MRNRRLHRKKTERNPCLRSGICRWLTYLRVVDRSSPIDLLNRPTVLLYHSALFAQSQWGRVCSLPHNLLLPGRAALYRIVPGELRDDKTQRLEYGTVRVTLGQTEMIREFVKRPKTSLRELACSHPIPLKIAGWG